MFSENRRYWRPQLRRSGDSEPEVGDCQGVWDYDYLIGAESPEGFEGCKTIQFALFDESLETEGATIVVTVLWNGAPETVIVEQQYSGYGKFESVIAYVPSDNLTIWATDVEWREVCPQEWNFYDETGSYNEDVETDGCVFHLSL
jgi:hypothetical protein